PPADESEHQTCRQPADPFQIAIAPAPDSLARRFTLDRSDQPLHARFIRLAGGEEMLAHLALAAQLVDRRGQLRLAGEALAQALQLPAGELVVEIAFQKFKILIVHGHISLGYD